jgi:hypothetical protein
MHKFNFKACVPTKDLFKSFIPPKVLQYVGLTTLILFFGGSLLCRISIKYTCGITLVGLILIPISALAYIIWLGINTIHNTVDGMEKVMHGITTEQKKYKHKKHL